MGITSVKEIKDQRRSEVDSNGNPTAQRVWRVETDSAAYDEVQVQEDAAFPVVWGDAHPTAPYLTATDIQCDDDAAANDGKSWIVRVQYTFVQPFSTPFDQPPVDSWSAEPATIISFYDVYGRPFQNTAGDVYPNGLELSVKLLRLSIQRNEPAYDPALAFAYYNAVNLDFFQGAAPYTCKCVNIQAQKQFWLPPNTSVQVPYYSTTYEFIFDPRQFNLWVLSTGYRQKVNGQLQPISDGAGGAVKTPQMLDANGKVLSSNGTPYFQTFDVFYQMPFQLLGLPDYSLGGV